jgi:hypothetical protein
VSTVFYDSPAPDDVRRSQLYDGQVFVFSPRESAGKLCELAQELIEEAFGGKDPTRIHDFLSAEECAEILSALKPKFIHHPKAKEYIAGLLKELDCDPEMTYFDVPRLRTAFPGDYLKSGIAYAFHPHRDTWYSAPMCQLNWWSPVYEISRDNCMAFHPRYFDKPVRNGSRLYNYQEWNRINRFSAARHVKTDTRVQPHPEEPLELEPDLRIITRPGGMIVFSGEQLHSTVPNTSGVTRYSVDFRTVHLGDALSRKGSMNVDSACTGTTMGDYLQIKNLTHIPTEVIAMYEPGTPIDGRFAGK